MGLANASGTPFVSLRHAQAGRVGEGGRLPSGWGPEHAGIEIVDLHSPPPPWITLGLDFGIDLPGDYAGVSLCGYLPAAANAEVAVSAEFEFEACDNIEAVSLVLREWLAGGVLAAQSLETFAPDEGARFRSLAHRMQGPDRLAQPVLLLKRRARSAGAVTVTLRGLAFGRVDEYPRWLDSHAGG